MAVCFVLQIETGIRVDLGQSVRNYTGAGNSTIDFLQVKVSLLFAGHYFLLVLKKKFDNSSVKKGGFHIKLK